MVAGFTGEFVNQGTQLRRSSGEWRVEHQQLSQMTLATIEFIKETYKK